MAEICAQLCGKFCAIFSLQWFLGFHNHKLFLLLYSSLLQLQDLLHHNKVCTIYLSDSTDIYTVNLPADGTRA